MKSHNRLYLLFSILIFVVGCQVSKDIARPADAIPLSYRDVEATDTVSVADLPLKAFIKQPEILSLVDSALARNYDLQLAVKNIQASELLFKQSRLGNLPVLNLQVSASSSIPSDNSLNGFTAIEFLKTSHIEDYNLNAGLSWEADIWGKIRSQKQAALAVYLQTEEVKNAIQTRLVAHVAQGYYQLLMMDAQLKIAGENLRLNDSTLQIIRLQFNAGQVSLLAVQQAEALRLSAAQLIPQLEQQIAIQENALKLLTGHLPGPVARTATMEDLEVASNLNAGLPSGMVGRRPDVRQAELSLRLANARVGISKANLYPALTITASGGLNSFKASNWFNVPASLFGLVGSGITQPIFQRRQLKTQYELSKIDREKEVVRFREAVLFAVAEVSDELIKLEKLEKQYSISIERVKVLRKAVNNANMLFRSGMANYLEVITAQGNLLQSELQAVALKTSRLTASVNLYTSLGGGWR